MIKTLRARLTLFYLSLSVVLVIAFALLIYRSFKGYLLDSVDTGLLATARTLTEDGGGGAAVRYEAETLVRSGEGYVRPSAGGEVNWPVETVLFRKALGGVHSFDTVQHGGETFRVLYFPVDEKRVLRIGHPLKEVDERLRRLEEIFYLCLPFFVVVVVIVSYYTAGRAVLPVIKLTEAADKLKGGVLKERVSLDFPGLEIKNLVRVFNDMLDSIQRHVESHKRFTSDVSHEIRSPLTILKGSIEVALRKRRDAGEYERILKENLLEVNRLQKITENLLLLSRADYNIIEMQNTWFDLNELISLIVDRYRNEIMEKSLTVVEDYQEYMEVFCDRELLDEAMSNLFDNAVKYTPRGGSVVVKTEKLIDGIVVSFQDSGPGVPEDDRERIFERFYRVDKTRSRLSGGSGLGLAITKWIIEAHGGRISVGDADSGGAVFTVTLPTG